MDKRVCTSGNRVLTVESCFAGDRSLEELIGEYLWEQLREAGFEEAGE